MKELSLNILDVAMNGITAGADLLEILITECNDGTMTLTIRDNGCGMSEETLSHVTDPFYTTRTTRRVGLGLPLLKQTAEQCGGSFSVTSTPREKDAAHSGTAVCAVYDMNNIDFTPLGDVISTVETLIQGYGDTVNILFRHETPGKTVQLDTREVREILGEGISLSAPEILSWIRGYLEEQYQQ